MTGSRGETKVSPTPSSNREAACRGVLVTHRSPRIRGATLLDMPVLLTSSQTGAVADRTFEVEFLDRNQAYAFTFG